MSSTRPESKPTNSGPIIAAVIGCLGLILLGVLGIIVAGGLAYFNGTPRPTKTGVLTPSQTTIPIGTITITETSSPTNSQTASATSTSTISLTPTATFIFHPPTMVPTSTKTAVPLPTKTRTPRPPVTPIVTTINDVQYDFNFNTWTGVETKLAFGKGMRCSSKKDEIVTFDVAAKTNVLGLVFYRAPNQGRATILVDNNPVDTIDLYKANPTYRYVWTYKFQNPAKAHKIKILVLREKRLDSAGYQICFDGFKQDTVFTDDKNYTIRYGAWAGAWNTKALGGGYRLARNKDSSISFITRGRSFQWITARGPNYGKASVYVDTKLVVTVDLYFPVQVWQQKIVIDNLGRGLHTVSVIVMGQKHPESAGTGIVFDGILFP